MDKLVAGARLGPYEILAPLGSGGMGAVYRARDTRLQREVALKVLHDAFTSDSGRVKRFAREARAAAALSHPNVITVFDVGQHEERTYVVTELLVGEPLSSQLARGPLAPEEAIRLGVQMARGLTAAHSKGVVHRDLKPANLFVTRSGVLKILDFGLAQVRPSPLAASDESTGSIPLTEPGMLLGTLSYMSPEQAKGQPGDERSDVFSLGVVLHEALSGKHPFRRPTAAETLSAILRDDPPALRSVGGELSGAIDRIVCRCLQKDPETRFQSADDLAFALQSLVADAGARAVPRRHGRPGAPTLWWAIGVLALLILFSQHNTLVDLLQSPAGPVSSSPSLVRHVPIDCAVAGEFPVLDATFGGPPIRSARAYFKGATAEEFYFVEMQELRPGQLEATLPRPHMEARAITYYLEVSDLVGGVARTPSHQAIVVRSAGDCPAGARSARFGAPGSLTVRSASVPDFSIGEGFGLATYAHLLLRDSDPSVRAGAADALALQRRPLTEAASLLSDRCSATKIEVRLTAAGELAKLGHLTVNDALAPLLLSLKDDNASVRHRAVLAIGELAAPLAIAANSLDSRLKDTDPRVRRAAVAGLATLGSAFGRTRMALESAAQDSDDTVAEAAEGSLRRLSDSEARVTS